MPEFIITLPAGLPLPSLNDRGNWAARARIARDVKKAAWGMALAAKTPAMTRAEITVEYQPPDRRRRDPDNLAAAGKPAIDGLIAAGVLPDDDHTHVTRVSYTIGPVHPRGRIVIRIQEME